MKPVAFPRLTANRVFVVLFLVIATSPAWALLLDVVSSRTAALTPLPPLATWQDTLAFPEALARYLSLNIASPTGLAHLIISAKVNVFQETAEPVPGVIIGSEGWLYYTEGQQDYASTGVYAAADLDKMRGNVDRIQAQLEAQGIRLLIVIVPDKQSIYPEYLPAYARGLGADPGLDQIVAYFKQRASTPLLDLRGPLIAAKRQAQAYYRTDSHWTSYGAYVGWSQIQRLLSAELPGLEDADRLQDFTPTTHPFSGDLAGMLTMKDLWVEDATDWASPPLVSDGAGSTKPRLLIFGDSFTWALLPFLNQHFSHIRFDRVTPVCVNFASVAAEKPAAVIWLMVERNQQSLWCSPLNMPGQ